MAQPIKYRQSDSVTHKTDLAPLEIKKLKIYMDVVMCPYNYRIQVDGRQWAYFDD